jgi:hypothetical protein
VAIQLRRGRVGVVRLARENTTWGYIRIVGEQPSRRTRVCRRG